MARHAAWSEVELEQAELARLQPLIDRGFTVHRQVKGSQNRLVITKPSRAERAARRRQSAKNVAERDGQ